MKIDISADCGESFGPYKLGFDEELMPLISSANIACGWHAGDPMIMLKTVRLAKKYGVGVGSHTGFMDLMGFGRRAMEVSPEEYENYIIYQMGALQAFARAEGVKVQHATVHGAAGHMFYGNIEYSRAFVNAVVAVDPNIVIPVIYGPKGEALSQEAKEKGVRVIRKFFGDRAYTKDGNLANRKLPGSVIHDPACVIARVIRMINEKKVKTIDGIDIEVNAPSIMMHGDTPEIIEMLRTLRKALEAQGMKIVPMAELADGGCRTKY
jgi:UPF0271 protein